MLCKIVSKYPSVFSPKIKAPMMSLQKRHPSLDPKGSQLNNLMRLLF